MAMKKILSNGYELEVFVYEGEKIAAEYPSGESFEIPPHQVHTMLRDGILVDGTPCKVLLEKTPMTRLDIVVI